MPSGRTRSAPLSAEPTIGWRERKRQQIRERITDQALQLFLSRGFEATTLDDIAAAADISRRSFFHYFASKEELAFAWQDGFGTRLAESIRQRPRGESLLHAAQQALLSLIDGYGHEEALALAKLVHFTPVLRARDQAKYEALEQAMGDALNDRLKRTAKPQERLRARIVAMMVIGSLRVASRTWLADAGREPPRVYAEKAFAALSDARADAAERPLSRNARPRRQAS